MAQPGRKRPAGAVTAAPVTAWWLPKQGYAVGWMEPGQDDGMATSRVGAKAL